MNDITDIKKEFKQVRHQTVDEIIGRDVLRFLIKGYSDLSKSGISI